MTELATPEQLPAPAGCAATRKTAMPRQDLNSVHLVDGERQPLAFERLDPLLCSELLRDLYRLAPYPTP